MHLQHAHTLARARTLVAVLADDAGSDDAASAYEHVLIDLDRLHDDQSPDTNPNLGMLAAGRLGRFELATAAIDDLTGCGLDPLDVELLLCRLQDAFMLDGG